MIGLLLIAAGIYILAKGKIGVDNKRYLQKPKSIFIGIILIILGILLNFVNAVLIFFLFVVTIIVSYYIADEGIAEKPNTIQNVDSQQANNTEIKSE